MKTQGCEQRFLAATILMFVLFTGLCGPPAAAAQSPEVGLAFGMTRSALQLEPCDGDAPAFDRLTNLTGGFQVSVPLAGPFAVEAGLGLVGKGARFSRQVYMRSTYLEVPLSVRLEAGGPGARLFPRFVAGGTVSREVRCGGQALVNTPGQEAPPTIPFDCDDMRSDRWDVGAVVGVGAGVREGSRTWSLEVRHNWGVTDILSRSDIADVRNRNLSVALRLDTPINALRRRQ